MEGRLAIDEHDVAVYLARRYKIVSRIFYAIYLLLGLATVALTTVHGRNRTPTLIEKAVLLLASTTSKPLASSCPSLAPRNVCRMACSLRHDSLAASRPSSKACCGAYSHACRATTPASPRHTHGCAASAAQ